MKKNNSLTIFLEKHALKILGFLILAYIIFFSYISYWKFSHFLYNTLDLAIFNQVFFNTSEGGFFDFTIHENSYLGDHIGLFIFFLAPLYSLFKTPFFLLALQSIILGLSAVPVYLIARSVFNKNSAGLFVGALWLLNPTVQNINLYEFHLLPIAMFFLLFALYFFIKRKFLPFLIFCLLALTVREDVSMVVFSFGLLEILNIFTKKSNDILLEKNKAKNRSHFFSFISAALKNKKWIFTPIVLSGLWFLGAMFLAGKFNPEGSYKFMIYYQWLGHADNLAEFFINIFYHPFIALVHLASFNNFSMILGFLFIFFFMPLFAKKYWILAIGPFLQVTLGEPGGSPFVFKSHYGALFMPALLAGAVFGARNFLIWRKDFLKNAGKNNIWKIIIEEKVFLAFVLIAAAIYSSFVFGPLYSFFKEKENLNYKLNSLAHQKLVEKIPQNASSSATFSALTNLSSREKLYSLHYGFLGRQQFMLRDYNLPLADYALIDFSDFVSYHLQMKEHQTYGKYYSGGAKRISNYLENYGVAESFDSVILFKKNFKSELKLVEEKGELEIKNQKLKKLDEDLVFLGSEKFGKIDSLEEFLVMPISFFWQTKNSSKEEYYLKLSAGDDWVKYYPLGWGFYPPKSWQSGKTIKTNHWFAFPAKYKEGDLKIEVVNIKGFEILNKLRFGESVIEEEKILGEINS